MHWPEIWGPADLWGLILSPLVEDPGHGSGYLTTGPFTDCLSTALQLVRVAVETSESQGIPIGHFYLGKRLQGKTQILADSIGGCGAGRLYFSVEPASDIQPCVFLSLSRGNIRDRDFPLNLEYVADS